MLYLTLKIIHILAVISWFAGLFYLPRLFVYHATTKESQGCQRFCIMEHKLYYYIMYPAMIVTLITGLYLTVYLGVYSAVWLQLKFVLIVFLVFYHLYSGHFLRLFKKNKNKKSHVYFRFFNEVPTIVLILVVILVVAKPFY